MLPSIGRRTFLQGVSGAALLPFLGAGTMVLAQDATSVTIRLDADIAGLDPANLVGGTDMAVIRSVCQTLASFKAGSMDWEPDAAKSIKQISDTEIEFELNPGQTYPGYGEMTADDVKFSYERFITPAADGTLPVFANDFGTLDHVEVTGPYTGKIVLKSATPAFFVQAICSATGAILSRAATAAMGAKMATSIVGSGPYTMTDWQPGQQITLEQRADYDGPNKGTFQKIIIKPIPESKTALLSLLAGELAMTEVAPQDAAQLEGAEGITTVTTNKFDYTWIGMNVEKPGLSDIKVRQAIRLGLDVDTILAGAYNGTVPRSNALLADGVLGHWAEAPVYARDVEAAKALLAEAGQSALTLTFTYLNDATNEAIAQIAQANLAEIGVTVTLNGLDQAVYYGLAADNASKKLDLTLVTFAGANDPAIMTQWFKSSQIAIWNWQQWGNAEYDTLDAEAATTMDANVRAEKYVRMQQIMDESAAYVWLTPGAFVYGHANWFKAASLPAGTGWQPRLFALA